MIAVLSRSSFTPFSAEADYQVKEWLKVGANVAYSNIVSRYPDEQTTSGSSTNLFYITNNIAPIYPLYIRNADGSIKKDARGFTMYDYGNGYVYRWYYSSEPPVPFSI